MKEWLVLVSVVSAGIPSLAKMVVGIVRLLVMRKVIEAAIKKTSQNEIPNVIHALADLGSSLASETGRGIRSRGLVRPRPGSTDRAA